MNYEYKPRLVDDVLKTKLKGISAVLVRGPKWTGKTSTCEQLAKSALLLRDPDVYVRSQDALAIQPSLLLRGDRPRLIDEWQLAPVLWDAVIFEADKAKGAPAQFLLTGSATPVDTKKMRHSGTGRIARITMETMTLEESENSTKEVSLAALFRCQINDFPPAKNEEQNLNSAPKSEELPLNLSAANLSYENGEAAKIPYTIEGASSLGVQDYAQLICKGGWPAVVTGVSAPTLSSDYIDSLCESDMAEAANIDLDPDRARALLRALARTVAQEARNTTLLQDVKNSGIGMSEPTLKVYLNALRRLFVLEEIKAWAPTLRSRTPLRTASVRHFCDPSIAAAALETDADGLIEDLSTMGFLFESLCIRDLRVYARLLGGDVYHYRDKSGLEADAIIRLSNGQWAAIEIKLGGEERIEQAANHLKALKKKIDTKKTGLPAFLMVLTGSSYAYTREDGIHVCPLGCLAH